MIPPTGVPWRSLVVITAVVLCAHGLALRGWPTPPLRPRADPQFVVALHGPPPTPAATAPAVPAPVTHPPIAPRAARARASSAATATTVQAPSSAAAPVAIPDSATWHYALTAQWRGQRVSGDAVLAWRHDGQAYEASLSLLAPPLAPREQHSTGELADDGLRPGRFADRARSEQATHFDREGGRITFSSNRPDVALQAGAQDRLSVLLQLAALVAGAPERFDAGASVALQVAGTREAPEWLFTVEGGETLSLPGGSVRTLRLTRAPSGDYEPRLEVWLAPGQAYAPARLRLTPPNGDWLDLQWSGTDKR